MTEDDIRADLAKLEKARGIRVLYACESGSRAWGFDSPDSDYDIRFIYVHPLDWYLKVFPGKDVINLPIAGDSDMGGWDLRKCLMLLRKSNCALIEWLSSPIVYCEDAVVLQPVKAMLAPAFLAASACHHYLAMAHKKFNESKNQQRIKLKTYFYALRATLCAQYIVDHRSPPPVRINGLIDTYFDHETRLRYADLLSKKMNSIESETVSRIDWLDAYLYDTLEYIERNVPGNQTKAPCEEYDQVFQAGLRSAWRETLV